MKRPKNRDYWDDDPNFPSEDWQHDVSNGDTRQSYAEWLDSKYEQDEDDTVGRPDKTWLRPSN